MDNPEHERSSSSPNDKLRIDAVRRRGAASRGYEVTLDDGSSFFVVRELWEPTGLSRGDMCEARQLQDLASRSMVIAAREHAYRLLARREHSASQLATKLCRRGVDSHAAQLVLDELEDAGYLSDRRFAEDWIETRLRRNPAGMGALRAGLAQRGVSREVAEEALEAVRERRPEVFENAADRALQRIMRRSPADDPRRLWEKLGRRGFSGSQIREALSRAGIEEINSVPSSISRNIEN